MHLRAYFGSYFWLLLLALNCRYSWVLGSIVGCVYMFGFIMMTPQLFINYKLKSVAHMPWRTFMYKARKDRAIRMPKEQPRVSDVSLSVCEHGLHEVAHEGNHRPLL